MKRLHLFLCFLPLASLAQDAPVKVTYADERYMTPTFKTKKGFQVYDLKKCDGAAGCIPDGRFEMYADSLQKRKLYVAEIRNGLREGVWIYFDHKGNTMCEEEYSGGRLVRYTIFRDGTEMYEKTFAAPMM